MESWVRRLTALILRHENPHLIKAEASTRWRGINALKNFQHFNHQTPTQRGSLPHIQPHLSKLLNPLKWAKGATVNDNEGRFRPESWTSLGGNDLWEDEALDFI